MIQTPVIVTFANQKGGVGKTTLCVTFANYLVTKGVPWSSTAISSTPS